MKFFKIVIMFLSITAAILAEDSKEEKAKNPTTGKKGFVKTLSREDLYNRYLNISSESEKLKIHEVNEELNYFTVVDEKAEKKMVILKWKNEVTMISFHMKGQEIPYDLFKDMLEGSIIDHDQYSSIRRSLKEDQE